MFILTSFSFQNIDFSMNTGIEGDQNSEKVDKVKQDIDIKKDNSKALLNQVPSTEAGASENQESNSCKGRVELGSKIDSKQAIEENSHQTNASSGDNGGYDESSSLEQTFDMFDTNAKSSEIFHKIEKVIGEPDKSNKLNKSMQYSNKAKEECSLLKIYNRYVFESTNYNDDIDEAVNTVSEGEKFSKADNNEDESSKLKLRRDKIEKNTSNEILSKLQITTKRIMEKAIQRFKILINIHSIFNEKEKISYLLNAAYSKNQSNSNIVLIGSSPYYNVNLLKLDFGVKSNDLDKELTNKFRRDIEKLNNCTRERLMKKAEEVAKTSKLDISQFIKEANKMSNREKIFSTKYQKPKKSDCKTKQICKRRLKKDAALIFRGESSFKLKEEGIRNFFVPTIGSNKIVFEYPYEQLINISLYFGRYIKLSSYIFPHYELSSDLQTDMQVRSESKHFLSLCNELSGEFYKELLKKIQKSESEFNIQIKNQSEFLMQEHYIGISNKEQKSLIKYPETEKILDFQWGKEKEISKLARMNFDSKENIELWNLDKISTCKTSSLTQSQIFVAELYYGSYCDLFKIKTDDKKVRDQIILAIITRSRTIVDIVKSLPLTYTDTENYSKKFWRFLLPEMLDYNQIIENTSECDRILAIEDYEDKQIQNGFDSLYKINSTFGCIKVIGHFEKLCSSLQFLHQTSLNDFLGFEVTKKRKFRDCQLPADIVPTKEMIKNKIVIFKKIKCKLLESIDNLKQVAYWRFLADNIIESTNSQTSSNVMKNSRSHKVSTLSFEEELKFKSVLIYMYMYACLKNQKFYPDFNCITQLVCEQHPKNKANKENYEICRCVYGFDDQQIEEFVKGNSTLNGTSFAHFDKYFIKTEDNKTAILKKCHCEKVKDKLSRCPTLTEGIDCLKKRWGYSLTII